MLGYNLLKPDRLDAFFKVGNAAVYDRDTLVQHVDFRLNGNALY